MIDKTDLKQTSLTDGQIDLLRRQFVVPVPTDGDVALALRLLSEARADLLAQRDQLLARLERNETARNMIMIEFARNLTLQ